MEQKTLARWLKIVLAGVGICGLLVFLLLVPDYGRSLAEKYPEFAYRYYPWLFFLWAAAIPCYVMLFLGWRIAGNIGRDRTFSTPASTFLRVGMAARMRVSSVISNLSLRGTLKSTRTIAFLPVKS